MKYTHSEKGFTIIETSLVLAIAGLILVMAFVALPALQRQTRDAKRKEDAATFMQALTKYQENNRGQLPAYTFDIPGASVKSGDSKSSYTYARSSNPPFNTSWETSERKSWRDFYNNYLGDGFVNPDGEKYRFAILNCVNSGTSGCSNAYIGYGSNPAKYDTRWADFNIYIGAVCNSEDWMNRSLNSRNVAIIVMLESGHTCIDN